MPDGDLKPLWVDLHRAIRLSGLKWATLYRLIGEGPLESRKIGRRRLIRVRSTEERAGVTPSGSAAKSRRYG
jgi:hypothetical protein